MLRKRKVHIVTVSGEQCNSRVDSCTMLFGEVAGERKLCKSVLISTVTEHAQQRLDITPVLLCVNMAAER